jgi:type VI secretion system secreted protein VgrG
MATTGTPLRIRLPFAADVVRLRGHEGLSELFEFECDVLVRHGIDVAFERLLGTEVTVSLESGEAARYFSGMVARIGETDRDEERVHLRIRLVPRVWRLTRLRRSRVFQQQTVPAILQDVFAGLDVAFETTARYHPRNYCVQYRETDFDFASRLMEEEGIRYCFRHGTDGHQMVLRDQTLHHPDIPSPARLNFDPVVGGTRREAGIIDWESGRDITSEEWTLRDDHFQLAGQKLTGAATVADELRCGQQSARLKGVFSRGLAHDEGSGGFARHFDAVGPDRSDRPEELQLIREAARATAQRRAHEEATQAFAISGRSHVSHLLPGHAFELVRHPPDDGRYYLTRVEHEATQSAPRSGSDLVFQYENRFECLPWGLPYHPVRRTPKPIIAGTQTAVVVGPKSAEVHLDRLGRVKVRFPWHGASDVSCWLRVAQAWAGPSYGTFFWPRVGHEVVVAFEEGDPDRPLVVGSVFNASNMPPFELPTNALVSGIKSASANADPLTDYNGVLLHDRKGEEHVQIHSQQADIASSEKAHAIRVGVRDVNVVGGLPTIGDAKDAPSQGWRSHLQASGSEVLGAWASDLDFTFGNTSRSVLGTSGSNVAGAWTDIFVNPLGWIGQSPVAAGAGATMGKNDITLATDTWLIYGPQVFIQRGRKLVSLERTLTPGVFAAASVLGGMVIAANILAPTTAREIDRKAWAVLSSSVSAILPGILVGLETRKAQATACKALADLATDCVEAGDVSLETMESLKTTKEYLEQAVTATTRVASLAAGGTGTINVDNIKVNTKNYLVNAEQSVDMDVTTTEPTVNPQMLLRGKENLWVLGDESLRLSAGDARVSLSADGAIVVSAKCVDIGDKDTELARPSVHWRLSNWINMTSGHWVPPIEGKDGIPAPESRDLCRLSLVKLGVSLERTNTGMMPAQISLTKEGVRLYQGTSEIRINTQGITIQANKVELDAAVQLSKKAPLLQQTAKTNQVQVNLDEI